MLALHSTQFLVQFGGNTKKKSDGKNLKKAVTKILFSNGELPLDDDLDTEGGASVKLEVPYRKMSTAEQESFLEEHQGLLDERLADEVPESIESKDSLPGG